MRILLAMDDSRFSQEAMRSLINQVQPKGTKVRVLHVIAPVPAAFAIEMAPYVPYYSEEVEEDRRKQADKLVQGATQKLRNVGFAAKGIVDAGDPKEMILSHASDWNADLIILGSHGLKGLGKFLMGSVSEAVARHAGCSVQIVRIRGSEKKTGKSKV
jgi:nucleotide-binding universal stress UspA family protein